MVIISKTTNTVVVLMTKRVEDLNCSLLSLKKPIGLDFSLAHFKNLRIMKKWWKSSVQRLKNIMGPNESDYLRNAKSKRHSKSRQRQRYLRQFHHAKFWDNFNGFSSGLIFPCWKKDSKDRLRTNLSPTRRALFKIILRSFRIMCLP